MEMQSWHLQVPGVLHGLINRFAKTNVLIWLYRICSRFPTAVLKVASTT